MAGILLSELDLELLLQEIKTDSNFNSVSRIVCEKLIEDALAIKQTAVYQFKVIDENGLQAWRDCNRITYNSLRQDYRRILYTNTVEV